MKTLILILNFLLLSFTGCETEPTLTWQEQAEQFIDEKDFTGAINLLQDVIAENPENQEAHYFLGQAYRSELFDDGGQINKLNPRLAFKPSYHFKRAIEISPGYKGEKFVVGPYTKIQGIWSSVGMTYLYRGDIDSAKWAFKKGMDEGGFYPAIMEYNKNIMASCRENAILFTNGDNDTQPMWYLQLIEGYRKDITVVNVSLLNVPWYIKMLKNNNPTGDNQLFLNLSDKEIDELKPIAWTSKMVELDVPGNISGAAEKIEWQIEPTIENKAIRLQDLMIIEILRANNWNRPVYFSSTVTDNNKLGMFDYLALQGLVYKLQPRKEIISIELLRHNCLNVYTYDGVNDDRLNYVEELKWLYQNYRYCYTNLASHYLESNDKTSAGEIINLLNKNLPVSKVPFASEEFQDYLEDLESDIVE